MRASRSVDCFALGRDLTPVIATRELVYPRAAPSGRCFHEGSGESYHAAMKGRTGTAWILLVLLSLVSACGQGESGDQIVRITLPRLDLEEAAVQDDPGEVDAPWISCSLDTWGRILYDPAQASFGDQELLDVVGSRPGETSLTLEELREQLRVAARHFEEIQKSKERQGYFEWWRGGQATHQGLLLRVHAYAPWDHVCQLIEVANSCGYYRIAFAVQSKGAITVLRTMLFFEQPGGPTDEPLDEIIFVARVMGGGIQSRRYGPPGSAVEVLQPTEGKCSFSWTQAEWFSLREARSRVVSAIVMCRSAVGADTSLVGDVCAEPDMPVSLVLPVLAAMVDPEVRAIRVATKPRSKRIPADSDARHLPWPVHSRSGSAVTDQSGG